MVLTLQNAINYMIPAFMNAINYSLFYNFTVVLSHLLLSFRHGTHRLVKEENLDRKADELSYKKRAIRDIRVIRA